MTKLAVMAGLSLAGVASLAAQLAKDLQKVFAAEKKNLGVKGFTER